MNITKKQLSQQTESDGQLGELWGRMVNAAICHVK